MYKSMCVCVGTYIYTCVSMCVLFVCGYDIINVHIHLYMYNIDEHIIIGKQLIG